jgi:ABC-type uncharacterized transport system ATPase subunit
MNEQQATLRVENATKRYGDYKAVDDLSFEVKPAEFSVF